MNTGIGFRQCLKCLLYLLKPRGGRTLEAINVVPEQGGIYAGIFRESGNIDFIVFQEEFLKRCRHSVFVCKAFKTDIHIQIRPMNALKANPVMLSLLFIGIPQGTIPQQRLTEDTPGFILSVQEPLIKPYFLIFIALCYQNNYSKFE